MTIVMLQIFLHTERRVEHLIRILSLDPHEMPLNIDMKIIRPVNLSGVTLNLDSNSWTLLQSCNVVNPGKYSTRIPSAHHQLCPKILYCDELLNQSNCRSQAVFDVGF